MSNPKKDLLEAIELNLKTLMHAHQLDEREGQLLLSLLLFNKSVQLKILDLADHIMEEQPEIIKGYEHLM